MSYIVIEGDLESGVSRVVGPFESREQAGAAAGRNIAVQSFVRDYEPNDDGNGDIVIVVGTMSGGVYNIWGPFDDEGEAEAWASDRDMPGAAIVKLEAS